LANRQLVLNYAGYSLTRLAVPQSRHSATLEVSPQDVRDASVDPLAVFADQGIGTPSHRHWPFGILAHCKSRYSEGRCLFLDPPRMCEHKLRFLHKPDRVYITQRVYEAHVGETCQLPEHAVPFQHDPGARLRG